ncbi:neutrophil antibiotic peptide NP-2-like [Grammomys surdaster]|uniref:neutrophil antibiotic peptide NP-2-like n=1 Tax=Grammomys surdaster TaxID=491861 RepID=UPI0010A0549D|nr:neutrophil antibiotic peptide NP-2-like [Grammomys surdaster]
MRMLTLLTTLLLLALQTQAESPPGRVEEDSDREPLVEEDQDIFISVGGDKGTALQDTDVKSGLTCYCRLTRCGFGEQLSGICRYRGRIYRFCCR